MKRFFILALVLTLAVTLFAGCSGGKSDYDVLKEKGKVIVGITDYAPMDYKDENGEWTGFDAELAGLVFKELGLEVEFVEIDWDRKVMELNAGSIDCVWNGMTLTPEVTSAMDCSKPYVLNSQVVVMSAEKAAQYTDAASLAELTVAIEAGSAADGVAADNGLTKLTKLQTQAKALMEVAAGTSDACIIDKTMAQAMTGEGTSYPDLTIAVTLTDEEYGIGFRKGSDVLAKVDEIIAKLRKDGTLQALADTYKLQLTEG